MLPWVDLVLLDLKIMDAERHTSGDGRLERASSWRMRGASRPRGMPMWIRTPVIPGYTDDVDNIRAIGRFIRDALPTVERWDLLAYTNLGKPKYHRLDLPYALEDAPLLTSAEMETVWQAATELTPVARCCDTLRIIRRAAK